MDKKEALELVQSFDDNEIKKIPKDLWKDRDFVGLASVINGSVLQFADQSLRNDGSLVAHIATQNGSALRYAGETLRKDRDFAIKCVTLDGLLLRKLDTKFKKDKEVIVEAIAQTSAAWWDVDESVREDLKNDPDISGLLPDHFFNDN